MKILLTSICILAAALSSNPQPQDEGKDFKSAAARAAQRNYKKALRRAEQAHFDANRAARAKYIEELDAALKQALTEDDLQEALAIRVEQHAMKKRVDDITEVRRLLRKVAAGQFEERTWKGGDKPLELMAADEGFCYLSGVSGALEGSGEAVRVYLSKGKWYIGGRAAQPSLTATAMLVRFR